MTLTVHPQSSVTSFLNALRQRRFFKLIGGGSFTDLDKIGHLVKVYAMAGVDCIDIAPEPEVIRLVAQTLETLYCRPDNLPPTLALPRKGGGDFNTPKGGGMDFTGPMVMVSIPLDPDPHFQKIDLSEPDCIQCGLCLSPCPTNAITLPENLEISQTLCYGCGRCVPVCPTNALSLRPFHVESHIEMALSHPVVGAVEIHSRMVDPEMLAAFLTRWERHLSDKLLSLCFQPRNVPPSQMLDFYQVACAKSRFPVILQIDGAPMSGDADPNASRSALDAALYTLKIFQNSDLLENSGFFPNKRYHHFLEGKYLEGSQGEILLTISGGINGYTSGYLREERYHAIAGVGMGTMARKAIWMLSEAEAIPVAQNLVGRFQRGRHEK